jgi:hypothetical protein
LLLIRCELCIPVWQLEITPKNDARFIREAGSGPRLARF